MLTVLPFAAESAQVVHIVSCFSGPCLSHWQQRVDELAPLLNMDPFCSGNPFCSGPRCSGQCPFSCSGPLHMPMLMLNMEARGR